MTGRMVDNQLKAVERAGMIKPKVLDLFCGAGGASMGLYQAGYDVTGVDIAPQPRYPFTFVQADALTYPLEGYDLIWASPPCQHYTAGLTRTVRLGKTKKQHPALIDTIRQRLRKHCNAWDNIPYIIENVQGAPLQDAIMLCGTMFGLRVQRHRYFESNLFLWSMPHSPHRGTLHTGEYIAVYNGKWQNSSSTKPLPIENTRVAAWSDAMGIDWMTKQELTQAIPPVYSRFLAEQIINQRNVDNTPVAVERAGITVDSGDAAGLK